MNKWPFKSYVTARAVIVEDGKMLAFHRKRTDRSGAWMEYYSIPGGEIDKGETPEMAVVRELAEEMGVVITTDGLIAHHCGKVFEHYIFSARITAGSPRAMADSEEMLRYASQTNQYDIVWVDVERLTPDNLKFYGMFYEHIKALAGGKSVDEVSRIPVPDRVY